MKSQTSRFSKQCFLARQRLVLLFLCTLLAGCASHNAPQETISRSFPVDENAININESDAIELERLPFVGRKTAKEIVRYRTKFGKFRRPEHLMLVKGISDKRFRKMRSLIRVE